MNAETATVIKRNLEAFKARELEPFLDTYAEEAVFINNLQPGVVRGKAALRAFWTEALGGLFNPEVLSSLTVTQQEIEGEIAYLLWAAEPEMPLGSDTFLVREGKILAHTATVQVRSR